MVIIKSYSSSSLDDRAPGRVRTWTMIHICCVVRVPSYSTWDTAVLLHSEPGCSSARSRAGPLQTVAVLSFHMTDVPSLFWGLPSSPNIELRLRPFNQEAASALLETLVACRRLTDDGWTVGSNKKKINGRRFTLGAAVARAADIRGQCVILEELMAFSLWCFCRETMRSEQTRLKEVTLLTGGAAAGSSSNATNTAEIWTQLHYAALLTTTGLIVIINILFILFMCFFVFILHPVVMLK